MWIDIQQNTEEWLDLRIGKVTGSSIGKIMAKYGSAFGEPAKRLAINLALERITGRRIQDDHYINEHMERGHKEEPIARMLYENTFFVDVTNGGFYDNDTTGCSPDGLVMGNGVAEIKSVIPTTHYATIKRGKYDPAYKWQYIFNIRESKREWLDFVSFCSSYTKDGRLYTYRIERESIKKELEQVENRLGEFEILVAEKKREIRAHGKY